jgi:hypothetical protein
MEWFQNQHKYGFHASINGIQPLCQESHLERPTSAKYIDIFLLHTAQCTELQDLFNLQNIYSKVL